MSHLCVSIFKDHFIVCVCVRGFLYHFRPWFDLQKLTLLSFFLHSLTNSWSIIMIIDWLIDWSFVIIIKNKCQWHMNNECAIGNYFFFYVLILLLFESNEKKRTNKQQQKKWKLIINWSIINHIYISNQIDRSINQSDERKNR